MRAVKPKILPNMDEETQTEIGAEVNTKKSKGKGEKDTDTKEASPGADHIAIDKHNVMYCDKHPDKKIEYYCRIHGELPCSRCAIENHRKCQGMSIIEDIASLPKTQKDVYRVSEKLEDAAIQIDTQRQKDKHVLNNLDESVKRINFELKHYKDKMYKITDSIENRLTKRTDKLYKERNKTVTGHLDLCNDTGAKIEKLKETMELIQTTEDDAERFVILQKVKKAFQSFSTPIHNLHRDAIDVQIDLRLNIDLDKTLEHIDKKMTVEVKTLRRGEPVPKDKPVHDYKRKGGRKAEADAMSTMRSIKSTGRKEGPHKFLAQRNFKPYKIPPYTVEKKQPPLVRGHLKPSGSLTSAKKGKPMIIISGENIGSQATSKRHGAAMFSSIESIPEKEDQEVLNETVNKDRVKVEKSRQSKPIAGESKAVRYTWGNYSNTITVGDSKNVTTSGTETVPNKTSQNARYNKSVFQSFERKPSKDGNKDQQSYVYKKSGASSQTDHGLYRNYKMSERQKQKQNAFDKFEKSAEDNTKQKPVIRVPGTMTKVGDKEEAEISQKQKNDIGSNANENHTGNKINTKANIVTSVKRKSDDYKTNGSKGEQETSVSPKRVSLDTEKDSGIALDNPDDNKNTTKNDSNTITDKRTDAEIPRKANGNGKQVASQTVDHTKESAINSQSPGLKVNNDNGVSENKENQNQSDNSNNKRNDQTEGNSSNETKSAVDNQIITAEEIQEQIHSEEINENKEEHEDRDILAKAFVTDVSMDSETKTIAEKTIERRMKTKSADRLRVRTSSSSIQRAKSDK